MEPTTAPHAGVVRRAGRTIGERLRKLRNRLAILSIVLAAALVAVLWLLVTGRGGGDHINVYVREGAPTLTTNSNAMVVMRQDLFENLVREGIQQADLPFDVRNVHTDVVATGILLTGQAGTTIFTVPIHTNFSVVVHPQANSDGTLGVKLTQIRAIGGQLPSVFEPAIEHAINAQIKKSMELSGFRVEQVELGEDEILVYLHYAGGLPAAAANP